MKFLPLAALIAATVGFQQNAYAQDDMAAEEAAVEEAVAEEESSFDPWVFALTFVSDYRFRGISQTLNDPGLQGSVTRYFENGLYAGAWLGNTDFGPAIGADYEVDLTLGYATEITDGLTLDLGLTRYNYPSSDVPIAYTELVAKASAAGFTGVLGYSNDVFNTNETGVYYGLEYTRALTEDGLSAKATIGYYDLDDVPASAGFGGGGITDYSFGISKAVGDSLTVGLTYVNTNNKFDALYGETNDNQVVFSMGATF